MKMKRLINFGLPVAACNMRCSYCYVSQVGWNTGDMGHLDYPPEHIQRCLTRERLGGVCHINMCGSGETLLAPYTVDLARRMLENGHYVTIVTNGTITHRIEELCRFPEEYKERLFFKFSLHYLELKRLSLLDKFFENVRFVQEAGCSFSIELGAGDEYAPCVEEIKAVCEKEVGSPPFVIELRQQGDLEAYSRLTELSIEEHQTAYQQLHAEMFNFQQEHWSVKRCEFCYAGDWVMQLEVGTGWFRPCFIGGRSMQNIYEDPDEPIRFAAMGENCPWAHCYSGYVLLSSGVVPSLETPRYAEFRDSVDSKGRHWLRPGVAEFFSSKFAESNEEYSQEKKTYINALMALEYKNQDYPYQPQQVGDVIAAALERREIKTVGIWGADLYTDWLFDQLIGTAIQVKYIVAPTETTKKEKTPWRHIFSRQTLPKLFQPSDRLPRVDAMVIIDYPHFHSIKAQIPPVYRCLLSLTELAD